MFRQEQYHREIPALKGSFFRAVARTIRSHKLGDLLVAGGVISAAQLNTALAEQAKTGQPIGKILVGRGVLSVSLMYRQLAEQWCLKAAATGITLIMQTMTPTIAGADPSESSPTQFSPAFTLAAATPSPAQILPKDYSGLFGAQEIRSDDISAFKKWTSVMKRFEDQMKSVSTRSPRVMMWKAEIQRLKDKPAREQIEAVNEFLNKIPYVEDIDNYGVTDYWATPVEFLSRGGDCEDYAIAKYASLRALGFSADQMRIAIVQDEVKNIPHAILIVYSEAGNFVLDNQDKKAEYAENVIRYKPIFSLNSTSWWLYRA